MTEISLMIGETPVSLFTINDTNIPAAVRTALLGLLTTYLQEKVGNSTLVSMIEELNTLLA